MQNIKHTVLDLFHVCSNHASLNYCGQESKNNLQFMILTYLLFPGFQKQGPS